MQLNSKKIVSDTLIQSWTPMIQIFNLADENLSLSAC